jgi:hypothetical protein
LETDRNALETGRAMMNKKENNKQDTIKAMSLIEGSKKDGYLHKEIEVRKPQARDQED